ncbi:S8 family serine peptidase [Nitrospirillum pindoramense]|uniref:Subtilisin family serine protease n=1 Tax=Nitrospirillum amazonense TaxID=28077 RepID=A0A560H8J0_9PROT|nr:S8 family serine peptidase [Nitrospirillum amazonense]TWB42662.1 subtilisin family serine protease [Nitrospirillum amazonense]
MTAQHTRPRATFGPLARLGLLAGLFVPGMGTAQTYAPGYSSSWWSQLGLTNAIEVAATGGSGITIGVVDTGVVATQADVTGRVSTASACAARTFTCPKAYTDDNGHGTATAAIAAGAVTSSGGGMAGIAPKATILAEKALNVGGSGSDVDVANGIIKAADAGARVINLSLTYLPTSAIVSAINYAAAKGAVLVFAGGNSATVLNGGANTGGLSAAALAHLAFAGSVNGANKLSSFSNTPGTGSAIAGTTRVSYASLWLMAPGESIVAPGIQYGSNALAYWSGTSMAAPMVSGAVALLEATWPVLYRNGTATAVLFASATDMGTKGVDSTYGNGLMNLTAAFKPLGTLSVVQANGKSLPVTSLSGTLITGGALGALNSISAHLAAYTAFDGYQRNFTVNLSGLVAKQPVSASSIVAALPAPTVTTSSSKFADGGSLTLAYTGDASGGGASARAFPASLPLAGREGYAGRDGWALAYSQGGLTLATGRGFPASASFAQALWGGGTAVADAAGTLGVSTALTGLAQGGGFAALGADLDGWLGRALGGARLAVSWSGASALDSTDRRDLGADWNPWRGPVLTGAGWDRRADAVAAGLNWTLARGWTTSLTASLLDERDGLLGSRYRGGGVLGLGDHNNTVSVGVATAMTLWQGGSLMVDASLARSAASENVQGVVSGIGPLLSRSYGLALAQRDAIAAGDSLTALWRRPLRVVAGSATLLMTSVDDQGYATTVPTRVSLRPDGAETDMALTYAAPVATGRWGQALTLNTSLELRQDAGNIRGLTDHVARVGLNFRF